MKLMRTDPREGCSGTVKGDKSGKTVCYFLPPENLERRGRGRAEPEEVSRSSSPNAT